MRVTLAKDVIRTIKTNNAVSVEQGSYIDGRLSEVLNDMVELEDKGRTDARKVLKRLKGTPCIICAKGALLLTHVLRNDKMNLQRFVDLAADMNGCSDLRAGTYPAGIAFTRRQLDEIEGLFEGQVIGREAAAAFTETQHQTIRNWYSEGADIYGYREPKLDHDERLIAIMKLVVKSKGKKILL